MTREVVTVAEEDNLQEVRERLRQHSFHHLPVVDGARLVGLLSQRDVLRASVAGSDQGAFARVREQRYLEQTFVRDVMQTSLVTAKPDDGISQLAQRMLKHRVGALPVVDEQNNLLGIVTENDLVRTLVETP
ncbi:MAG TPA: CBS domain-containing protein [Polyangiales bacterium]